jgi:hypothetical protein
MPRTQTTALVLVVAGLSSCDDPVAGAVRKQAAIDFGCPAEQVSGGVILGGMTLYTVSACGHTAKYSCRSVRSWPWGTDVLCAKEEVGTIASRIEGS